MLKRNVGRFPLFDPIVEDAPDIQCVDSLPTEVVNPAAQDLLAFKFNGLRSIFGAGGNLPGGGVGGRGRARFAPEESWGKVVAIDPLTGVARWEYKVLTPPWGGVMSTAGNLVFGGTQEGVVFALNATTGERLWYFAGNDRIYASPISYLVNGKQYVSLAIGDLLATFGL